MDKTGQNVRIFDEVIFFQATYNIKTEEQTGEEKNLENVLINGRQTMRKINQCFQCLVSSSGKRRKTDNNKKKKEAEKRTDENVATKLDQTVSHLSSSLLLSSFCCCLSSFT